MNSSECGRADDYDDGTEVYSERSGFGSYFDDIQVKIRLIDCVGFMVMGRRGIWRMIRTGWLRRRV